MYEPTYIIQALYRNHGKSLSSKSNKLLAINVLHLKQHRSKCLPESWTIVLWPAPAPGVRSAAGQLELGFDSDVDAIRIRLVLHLDDPLHVGLESGLHAGEGAVVGLQQGSHGQGSVSHPVDCSAAQPQQTQPQ